MMGFHEILLCLQVALASEDPHRSAREVMEAAGVRQREAIERAMAGALARQRAAVQAQVRTAQSGGGSFFTTPWSEPLIAAPAAVNGCDPIPHEQLGPLIREIAAREGLTPDLLRAVIQKESAWLPCAVSQKGAQGLMQLMPATAWELGVADPFDPAENVAAGARLLRRLLSRYGGDLALALGAYNAGPAYVDAFRGLPPFRETLNYVSSILGKVQTGPRDLGGADPE